MVDCGAGALATNSGAPSQVELERSVRTKRARRTAPSILISPMPCSNVLKPANGCAVYIRIALTRFGVSLGFAWSNNAAAPATTGVDIDVPLKYIILRVS